MSTGMKAKTIKAITRKKIDRWLATIDDDKLRERVSKNVVVTGGAIASMLLGEKVNDFDVYFRDHDTTLEVARYYLSKFKTRNRSGIETPLSIAAGDGRVRIVQDEREALRPVGHVLDLQFGIHVPAVAGEFFRDHRAVFE